MVKVNHPVCSTAKNLTFRERSAKSLEGGNESAAYQGGSFHLELAGCSLKEQLEIHVFQQCNYHLCMSVQMNTAPGVDLK